MKKSLCVLAALAAMVGAMSLSSCGGGSGSGGYAGEGHVSGESNTAVKFLLDKQVTIQRIGVGSMTFTMTEALSENVLKGTFRFGDDSTEMEGFITVQGYTLSKEDTLGSINLTFGIQDAAVGDDLGYRTLLGLSGYVGLTPVTPFVLNLQILSHTNSNSWTGTASGQGQFNGKTETTKTPTTDPVEGNIPAGSLLSIIRL